MSEQLTRAEFEELSPWDRGYAVYMLGARSDQPNVPDESNPYSMGTPAWRDWRAGQAAAVQDVQESVE